MFGVRPPRDYTQEEIELARAKREVELEGELRQAQDELAEVQLKGILPPRYLKARSEDLQVDWDGESGLLLYGPKGVGKTHQLASALRYLIEQRKAWPSEMVWTSANKYFADLRRKMSDDKVVIPDLHSAKVVVLDDMGKQRTSDWVLEQLFELIDSLYNREAILLMTANVSSVLEIEAMVGEFAFDRLKDMMTSHRIDGESRRGKK